MEIKHIQFGILSSKEIKSRSVVEVTSPKVAVDLNNGVYDLRMGVIEANNNKCPTCGENHVTCPGHFGHIELATPILHPLFYKYITGFLRCFCFHCSRLLITRDQLYVHDIPKRFDRIAAFIEKQNICSHCRKEQPEIKFLASEKMIQVTFGSSGSSGSVIPVAPSVVSVVAAPPDVADYEMLINLTSPLPPHQHQPQHHQQQPLGDCGGGGGVVTFSSYSSGKGGGVQGVKKKKKSSYSNLDASDVLAIFDKIKTEDVELLGIDPELMHPRNLIIQLFPVLPTCCRPYGVTDGHICDDDLTNHLTEIIKINNQLKSIADGTHPILTTDNTSSIQNKTMKYIHTLNFKIATFFNNTGGKARHSTSNRSIKGLKERIVGKEGLIRSHLLGKRCDMSARTVAGADPTLRTGELAIPREVAEILTIPMRVSNLNVAEVQGLVDAGKVNFVNRLRAATGSSVPSLHLQENYDFNMETSRVRYNIKSAVNFKGTNLQHGDVIVRRNGGSRRHGVDHILYEGQEILQPADMLMRNGVFIDIIKYPEKRKFPVQVGDIVDRQLRDGDWLLLNRQPTLWAGGIVSHTVKIRPGKTFRVNLAITKSFNLDNDGDELNVHCGGSLESLYEMKALSSVNNRVTNGQSTKPNIVLVQDAILGGYLMTRRASTRVTRDQFYRMTESLIVDDGSRLPMGVILARMVEIEAVLGRLGKLDYLYSGRSLISLILPGTLWYDKENDGDVDEPRVKICEGVLHEGAFDKSVVGASAYSLILVLFQDFSTQHALTFVDNMQFVTNAFIDCVGFSVGLGDALLRKAEVNKLRIRDTISRCLLEAEHVKKITKNKTIREIRTCATLDKAKDGGLRIAKEALSEDNNFLTTVRSGSKGDFFNLAQITGLLGQQTIGGKRVPLMMNNGKRSLPYYIRNEEDMERLYESQGFITNSFIEGLNPRAFFFHAMCGREGICQTATGTATSGYMQRKIVKLTEDMKINADSTVRDAMGRIYQFRYADTGFDPSICQPNRFGSFMGDAEQTVRNVCQNKK